jgi:hypothetical protein
MPCKPEDLVRETVGTVPLPDGGELVVEKFLIDGKLELIEARIYPAGRKDYLELIELWRPEE